MGAYKRVLKGLTALQIPGPPGLAPGLPPDTPALQLVRMRVCLGGPRTPKGFLGSAAWPWPEEKPWIRAL